MIDATIIRAHACAAGLGKNTQEQEALGRSKGGFTSKIHALVDALGNPIKFILTEGQRNDITQATKLTNELKETVLIAVALFRKLFFFDRIILPLKQYQLC